MTSTTTTTRTTRCALYLRVSLDATGEGLAVERQREDCRKIAADRGWEIVAEFVDNSISASDAKKVRPGYDRLVADYAAGRFSAVVCYDLDRLTRQPRQLEDWIDAAEDRGLKLVTANGEADLATDAGRMFARIKAAVARQEIERKAARQRRAAQQRAEMGKPPRGVRLTGYTTDGQVVPDEAEIVREVFRRFANGETLKGIARVLEEQGRTTRRGRPWNASALRSMLVNPRYAGHAVYCGQVTGGQGSWQPLVSPDRFAVVQHRLNDPRRTTNREGTERKYLGSGVYRCGGNCGLRVRSWSGYRYRCADGHHSRSGSNVDAWIAGGTIDSILLDGEVLLNVEVPGVIPERLARPDLKDLLATPGSDERADELLSKATTLRDRLVAVEGDYDAGYIDGPRYAAARAKITTELEALEGERAALLAGTGPASVLAADNPVAAFRTAPLAIQRQTVDFLAEIVLHPAARGSRTFDPETVEVRWRSTTA